MTGPRQADINSASLLLRGEVPGRSLGASILAPAHPRHLPRLPHYGPASPVPAGADEYYAVMNPSALADRMANCLRARRSGTSPRRGTSRSWPRTGSWSRPKRRLGNRAAVGRGGFQPAAGEDLMGVRETMEQNAEDIDIPYNSPHSQLRHPAAPLDHRTELGLGHALPALGKRLRAPPAAHRPCSPSPLSRSWPADSPAHPYVPMPQHLARRAHSRIGSGRSGVLPMVGVALVAAWVLPRQSALVWGRAATGAA